MRLKVTFSAKEGQLSIPVNYQHALQGLIYNSLDGDEKFNTFLHEHGFRYEKRSFKLFTYSRL
ncbi:MAG: CRISPR-associated endoribonuclease Cas6, partial [Clostridia bacterium]|nr:CRISPR-associated endoribonuclease Cas6 [Clostridia bacterium]